MYFDFEDYRPDIAPVGRAISWREGVLISIIVHLVMIVFLLLAPRLFPDDGSAARARAMQLQPPAQAPRFVFVQPRLDLTAPKPPARGDDSDKDRLARSPERAPNPKNPLPFSRGNSPERVERSDQQAQRAQAPQQPNPAAGQQDQAAKAADQSASALRLPDAESALSLPSAKPPVQSETNGHPASTSGALGEALRNLQRYVQREQFDNPQGGGQPGASIQFDTKGVEFGPWLRRFIAQIRRNWFIPYAAMSMKGHVVITFNVHKDGTISELAVVGPCPVDAFNNAAFGALAASNPTQPLPPEYPADKAFFTVTFYYNEQPPQ
jgi:TonB family protein